VHPAKKEREEKKTFLTTRQLFHQAEGHDSGSWRLVIWVPENLDCKMMTAGGQLLPSSSNTARYVLSTFKHRLSPRSS